MSSIKYLLTKIGLGNAIKQVVEYSTDMRKHSLEDCTTQEIQWIMSRYTPIFKRKENDESADKMRKKIFHYAHLVGWELTPGGYVDVKRLNAWCIRYGHGKKPLNDYEAYELPTLVSQMEGVYRDFLAKPREKQSR